MIQPVSGDGATPSLPTTAARTAAPQVTAVSAPAEQKSTPSESTVAQQQPAKQPERLASPPAKAPAATGSSSESKLFNTAATDNAAPIDLDRLVERGQTLLKNGDVASARLVFELAARHDDPRAALLLAQTYDPLSMTGTQVGGIGPNYQQAVLWYRRAIDLKAPAAQDRLDRLVQYLERKAANGDEDAAAALRAAH